MRDGAAIQISTPILSAVPDSGMTLSALSDVGRLPEFKMASMETGSAGRHLEFRLQDNVGSVTDVSGMVANVGVAVRIGSRAHSVR